MRLALVALILATPFAAAITAPAFSESAKTSQVRDRVNKAWDERLEKIRKVQIEAGCKAEAAKEYSAIRFRKRSQYVKECIERAPWPDTIRAAERY